MPVVYMTNLNGMRNTWGKADSDFGISMAPVVYHGGKGQVLGAFSRCCSTILSPSLLPLGLSLSLYPPPYNVLNIFMCLSVQK